jgi:phenylacetate-CoA ligase/benzoylacetate-CoA ligase
MADLVGGAGARGGGESGRITRTPLPPRAAAARADACADAIANVWFTAGLRPGDIVAHLVGLPMVAGGLPYADGFRRLGAILCWLGGFPTERILREMRHLRVTAMLSTTSFALHLSEQWAAAGRETGLPSHLHTVLGGGEPGMQQREVRARIASGLALQRVRDSMGLGDVMPSMWSECEAEDGMHFNAQRYVAVELIAPDTGDRVPWSEGATGELVYTTFAREAMPVVRYRSRDHAQVVAMRCACGRTSPRMRCIGRTDDMLIYKGMNLFPSALRDLVGTQFAGRATPLLRIWKDRADQVRFDDPIPVEIESEALLDEPSARALAREIEDLTRARLQVRVAVTLVAPGSLPRSMYKQSLVAVRPASEPSA